MRIIIADLNKNLIDECKKQLHTIPFISYYHGSILNIKCDAIVSPANSFGFMDGGIDKVLSLHFGWEIQKKLQKLIREKHYGELLVGNAEIIETQNSKVPYIISAPTMRVPCILHRSLNPYLAIRAIINLVRFGTFTDGKAIKNKVKTIALSGMGTGVGGISIEIFIHQFLRALLDSNFKNFPKSWQESVREDTYIKTKSYKCNSIIANTD